LKNYPKLYRILRDVTFQTDLISSFPVNRPLEMNTDRDIWKEKIKALITNVLKAT